MNSAVNNNSNSLKAVGQGSGSGAGTNTSGFSALLAGDRISSGYFFSLGSNAFFWSSTEGSGGSAYGMLLNYVYSDVAFWDGYKRSGFSVRCVKDVSTDIIGSSELPFNHSLCQNYPNPFNPSTKIQFSIPKEEFVKLSVFNSIGQEIKVLVNQNLPPASYKVDFDGSGLTNGIYFYRLQAGEFSQTKKMILLK